MKMKDVLSDGATVAGCCIGVGFLSGKEAQLFWGNFAGIGIFALCFFVANTVLRRFCYQKNCKNVADLLHACFPKTAGVFLTLFLTCSFVCIVTMLAGVQDCAASFFPTPLPLFSVTVAVISALLLKKGLTALKVLNALSLLLAVAYLVALAFTTNNTFQRAETPLFMPIQYALFSTTMSLGVIVPMSQSKRNTQATLVATALLAIAMLAVLYISDFSLNLPLFAKTDNVAVNILGCAAIVLTTVIGVVANALPLTDFLETVIPDRTLTLFTLFCPALAFSLFGFDFALKYGYVFVSAVGLVLLLTATVKLGKKCGHFSHKKSMCKNCNSGHGLYTKR